MNPLESWTEEQRSAYLYRACATAEAGTVRAELFRRLAGEAEAQAAIWRAQLTAKGHPAPAPFLPDARTRLVAWLVGRFGPRRLRGILAAMKVRGMAVYGVASAREPGHVPPVIGGIELRHRGLGGGGNLRAAVFGVNDGLVSNASLILGVAGATTDPHTVVLSGIAGMAAGAFAMAAGEYVSVQSQRELYEHQIALERDELKQYPEAEAQELALIYAAKGLPKREAGRLAQRMVADPEHALDTLAREELGLNPDELGSPLGAAASSFVSFAAYSPESQIRARVWSFDASEGINAQFFERRIERALAARVPLQDAAHTGARLVYAESDGLPGVIADRYGNVVVLQLLSAGADRWRDVIAQTLMSVTGARAVYERSDAEVRTLEGLPPRAGIVTGVMPRTVTMFEGGLCYTIDIARGQKTGFYLDQRDNRALIRRLAKDKRVLNAFCYTGGFSLAALAGGAVSVLSIDSAADALSLARENLTRNPALTADRAAWREGNVFAELRQLRD